MKLLAQFPILEFYFLTLACYFVGMKEFFSPAIHLTARTFQLTLGAEGHVHKDQQLQPLRAPGTPCQIRGLGASVARLAEVHVSRQCSHVIHKRTMLLISSSPSQFCHHRGDVGCLLIRHKHWKLCRLSGIRCFSCGVFL